MTLVPGAAVASLGAGSIKALLCEQRSPQQPRACRAPFQSQRNTRINSVVLLDRDRVKLQVRRENTFWQISAALVVRRHGAKGWCSHGNKPVGGSSLPFSIFFFFQPLIPPGFITGTWEKTMHWCRCMSVKWEATGVIDKIVSHHLHAPNSFLCPSTRFKFLLKFISEGDRLSRCLVVLHLLKTAQGQ